jgi:uncharacterized phage protein (TIGR01671 family)
MREIKYRGKSVNDGRWVYGYYVKSDTPIESWILTYVRHKRGCVTARGGWEVQYDSVGQFTGLYDVNGNEIYEGDIVECVSWNEYFSDVSTGKVMEPFRRTMVVEYRNGAFKMIEKRPQPLEDAVWDIVFDGDLEVVGNIHDQKAHT